jgi:predicted amidophosphoribosyltransferase
MHDAYRCGGCQTIYDTFQEAENCPQCEPELVNVCDTCGKVEFDSDLIKECEESHERERMLGFS